MNSLSAHVEYLLRKHDCVVLPGIGALLCNYVPAHFSAHDDSVIVPPGRALAFNGLISDSDGLLASSVARKEGIPYEVAAAQVRDEMEMLRRQLDDCGEFQFGRLGVFVKGEEGQISFVAMSLPSVNGAFYGLKPLTLTPIDEVATLVVEDGAVAAKEKSEAVILKTPWWSKRFGVYASGVAAMFAVVVTCLLFLMSPIQTNKIPEKASLLPAFSESANVVKPVVKVQDLVEVNEPKVVVVESVSEVKTPVEMTSSAQTSTVASVAKKETNGGNADEPSELPLRFNIDDAYCVVVASFPTAEQAQEYINSRSSKWLDYFERDDKFRVYAATGNSRSMANAQRVRLGQADAWVCHR